MNPRTPPPAFKPATGRQPGEKKRFAGMRWILANPEQQTGTPSSSSANVEGKTALFQDMRCLRPRSIDVTIVAMSQVDLLYRLQQIDDEIRAGKKRLGQVIRSQHETEELLAARKRAESTTVELQEHQATQVKLNLELKSLSSKAQRSEQRLYSGTVKNPKELEDLQHELESLTRRRATLEDDLLEAMILVEEAQDADRAAQLALSEIEAAWTQEQSDLGQEQDELVARINELTMQRRKHLELISPESLGRYEDAQRSAGSTAVVLMKNGRCRGCLVTVPANLVKLVDEGQLIQCDSCGRILCPT